MIDDSLEAATAFTPLPDQLRSLRADGVTAVGLVFQGGTFPGRVGAAYTGASSERSSSPDRTSRRRSNSDRFAANIPERASAPTPTCARRFSTLSTSRDS